MSTKYIKYVFFLLIAGSCASQRMTPQAVQQDSGAKTTLPPIQTIPTMVKIMPVPEQKDSVPLIQTIPTIVETMPVPEQKETPESNVQPLVSQVQRAEAGTWQAAKQMALDSLCQSPIFETTQLGLYVYDLTDEKPLYAVNATHRMRPASCQKIVTAVTALHFLKGDYKLKTDFRITGNIVSRTLQGDLYVIGGMDPLVTRNELQQVAANIKQQTGIDSIAGTIVYDLSMRENTPMGWGWCWDDDYGPLSALLVDGKDTFEQYWLQALSNAGIGLRSKTGMYAVTDKQARSVCTIHHSIDNLLEPMMKKSDNIFAECLFYQIAASTGTKYAGHKQTTQRTEELMKRINLNPDNYKVADGSGLSLYNYASPEMLVSMLNYAWRTPSIREHLLPSLPIAGVDGTLQKRMVSTKAESNVRAKTGTVTGIVSLAGYLTATNGHVLTFCIINQGINTPAPGRSFQDKVCQELCR